MLARLARPNRGGQALNQETPPPPPGVPAGWYPDPERDDSQRYWDGEGWTDQRAPLPPSGGRSVPSWATAGGSGGLDESAKFAAGLALAGLGVVITIVSVFLPLADLESGIHIAKNSMIQHWEGPVVIGLALAGGAAALKMNWRPGCLVAGLLLVGLAVLAGTSLPITYRNEFSEIVAGDASPGAGVWTLGVGGAILACAAFFGDWSLGTAGRPSAPAAIPAAEQSPGEEGADLDGDGAADSIETGWYPDPENGAEERLWDGEDWTSWVRPAREGRTETDPAGWQPHPSKPGKERLWSGDVWTDHERDAVG